MPLPRYVVLARYDSLEDFFLAAASGAVPVDAIGGWVCVHPRELPLAEPGRARYRAARERAHAFRCRLVVTDAVGPHAVELRRYRVHAGELTTPAADVAPGRMP